MIEEKHGISRRQIHEALHGHTLSKNLVPALAELRDAGLAFCRTEATGGRPAECWYPGREQREQREQRVEQGLCSFALNTENEAKEAKDACEQREQSEQTPDEARAGDSSFALNSEPLTLMRLLQEVDRIGGRVEYDADDRVVVNAPADAITDAISQALAAHDAKIREILDRQAMKRLPQELETIRVNLMAQCH